MKFSERMKSGAASVAASAKKHKKGIIIGVSIALIVALFFTALYFTGVYDDRANAIVELEAPEMTVSKAEAVFGGGEAWSVSIRGKIRNNIRAEIKYVGFRFELSDAEGNVITMPNGTPYYAEDSKQNLRGGEEYEYIAVVTIPITENEPVSFRAAKTDF